MKYIVLRGEFFVIFNFFLRFMSNIVVLIFLLCIIRIKIKLEKIEIFNKDLFYFNWKWVEEEMGEIVFLENYILMLVFFIILFFVYFFYLKGF